MIKLKESSIIKDFEKGPIRRSLFSNGAVTLFHQHKTMTSSVVSLYFLAGSMHEKKGKEGIVHLIEHMLFKEGKDSQLVKELEFKGADINAYTYKEYVCFEMDCAAGKLSEFLPLFLSLFLNPIFTENDLKLEKQVVIQELRDELDDHEGQGHEYILNKCFNHDLGHPIGGSEKSVKSLSRTDLMNFYRKFFVPNRMILNVTSGSEFKGLENIFSQIMNQYVHMQTVDTPYRYKGKDKFFFPKSFNSNLKRKTENAIFYQVMAGASLESRHYFDLAVMDEIFFEGLSSKFYTELREKLGLLYGLGSLMEAYRETGLYIMIFNGQKNKLPQIKKHIERILNTHLINGFDELEVEAIKDRMVDGAHRSFDSIEERNQFIAMREIYGYSSFALSHDIESIRKVTPKRLKYLLKKMMDGPVGKLTILPKEF